MEQSHHKHQLFLYLFLLRLTEKLEDSVFDIFGGLMNNPYKSAIFLTKGQPLERKLVY